MESGNGLVLESETNAVNEEPVVNANKDAAKRPTNHEDLNKVDHEEVIDLSKTQVNNPGNRDPVKVSTTKGSGSKNCKLAKNVPNVGTFGRTPRPSLSQSLSFPAKTETPVAPTLSTTSCSRSHPSYKRASSGLKPIKTRLSVKEDDAATSNASPNASSTPGGQRRNSTSAIPFRVNERAERRKQYFSKIEEKVHAKKVEKTYLEEKSKESQEKDIKKLRKSLTFKAKPMPNFYKEPPPKPQLKKKPLTRPKSPKLGRSKSSLSGVSKSLEKLEISDSPRSAKDQTMSPRLNPTKRHKDTPASKKPKRKSLTKTSEVNNDKSKENVLIAEDTKEVHESKMPTVATHEAEGCAEDSRVLESGFNSGSGSPNQDMTPVGIPIGSQNVL
uniref:protein WVD2-like 4 n=1 Tax=Erigeron canadensis TaxID=72917 RepID=UPI001CB9A7D5|nr:protein WVD2-like 4 [Erigeron canadensis]